MGVMCGRFALATPLEKALAGDESIDLSDLEPMNPSWNVAPTQRPAVVHLDPNNPNGPMRVKRMAWGLRPSWSRPSNTEPINARLETVSEKPMFRDAFNHRRGLLPMDGWYEWMTTPVGQQPWYNTHIADEVLYAAVVHEEWKGSNTSHTSFAMLTTEANEDCKKVHHRMPVLLRQHELSAWVREAVLPSPTPAGTVKCHAVSREVNNANNDHKGLIHPLPTLF